LLADYGEYIEIVVVDGSSSSACQTVVSSHFSTLVNNYNQGSDKGIYDAMNKGVKFALGEQVLFLNSGDILESSFTFSTELFWNKDFKETIYFGDSLQKVKDDMYLLNFKPSDFVGDWWLKKLPCHQAIFIPQSYLIKFPFDAGLTISADSKLLFSAFSTIKKHKYLEQPICIFEIGGVSTVPMNLFDAIRHAKELSVTRNVVGFAKFKVFFHSIKRYILIRILGVKKYYYLFFSKNGYKKV